jgi:hypothetical protein
MANGDLFIGGYTIGPDQAVFAQDVDPGYPEIRVQDKEASNGDHRFFGRDYLTPPIWSMTLVVNQDTPENGLAVLSQLAGIWRDKTVRLVPNAETTLGYEIAGRQRMVYGRPRKFAYNPSGFDDGVTTATAEFATSDPLFYAMEQQSRRVTLVPAITGGFLVPFDVPIYTETTAEIQGTIQDVGGDEPTPFELLIHGPVRNPYAYGNGWEIRLSSVLGPNEWVTVNTRTMTALRNDGVSLAGYLSRGTRLADARLTPGPDRFVFGGIDNTGTAYAELYWHAAFNGF